MHDYKFNNSSLDSFLDLWYMYIEDIYFSGGGVGVGGTLMYLARPRELLTVQNQFP